jgi:hypothetical protein
MLTERDDLEARLRSLAADARVGFESHIKAQLLSLLAGYSQADVCIGGPPGLGWGVATVFRGRFDKPSSASEMSYPPRSLTGLQPGRCNRSDERVFYGSFTQSAIPDELRAQQDQRLYISRWTTLGGTVPMWRGSRLRLPPGP